MRFFKEYPVYDKPISAIQILSEKLGITRQEAREALQTLVKEGYVIAPREPTNSMLAAYLESFVGSGISKKHETIIVNIGKAKKRWAAMANKGVEVSLSVKDR